MTESKADVLQPDPSAAGGALKEKTYRAPPKSARRRSRELAMQGLYGWLLKAGHGAALELNIRDLDGFSKCDLPHFEALLHEGIKQAPAIDTLLAKHLDRKTELLSPVEHAILIIGCFELLNCPDIPYRVAINEAVELAKTFGGTDGHRYVNGVLDKCAAELRPLEARPQTRQRSAD